MNRQGVEERGILHLKIDKGNQGCDWLISTKTLNVIGLLNRPITNWQVN